MFVRTFGAAAVAVGFVATAAWADGMPEYSRVYAPAFSWTGFYVGANVGWERKRMVGSDYDLVNSETFGPLITDGSSSAAPTSQNLQGWIGGGQIGYNHQFGRAVIGTELSGSWNDVSGSGDCFRQGTHGVVLSDDAGPRRDTITRSCTEKQKWSVNWLNKLGIAHGRMMGYLIGGVALTEIDKSRLIVHTLEQQLHSSPAPLELIQTDTAAWSGSQIHTGVVLGAGAQFMIHDNVSLGIEWLHTTYAAADYLTNGTITNVPNPAICGGCLGPSTTSKIGSNAIQNGDSDTIRMVLNYKFGDHERAPLK